MEFGSGVAKAFLAGAEGTEVLGGFRDNVVVKVEVDPAGLVCDGSLAKEYCREGRQWRERVHGGVKTQFALD